MLKGQFSAANLLLTQVHVLPELSNRIQRGVVLETQATDLKGLNTDRCVDQKLRIKQVEHIGLLQC